MTGSSPTWILSMGAGVLPLGFVAALLAVLVYVRMTTRPGGERIRRRSLAVGSVVLGPVVGASLAWAHVSGGGVNPLDIGYTYSQYAGLGLIAGIMIGLAFLMTAALAPAEALKKSPGAPEL